MSEESSGRRPTSSDKLYMKLMRKVTLERMHAGQDMISMCMCAQELELISVEKKHL